MNAESYIGGLPTALINSNVQQHLGVPGKYLSIFLDFKEEMRIIQLSNYLEWML
jgi:hypothetical protein